MNKYILLARHGSVDRDADTADSMQGLQRGGQDVKQVAGGLADHLRTQPGEAAIRIGEIWHGSYKHVRQTAGIFDSLLKTHLDAGPPAQLCESEGLDPETFWAAASKEGRQQFGVWLLERVQKLSEGEPKDHGESGAEAGIGEARANAVLTIGHAPHLGWIAEKILRRPQPIARAELLCIAISDSRLDRLLRRDRWLMWAISTSDDQTMEALKEKIESKKRLAEVLGGLIIAILGVLLGFLLDAEQLPWDIMVSAGLFFAALALYLATAYAYDRLLMPTRFWAEKAEIKDRRWLVQRPPSSATWVLYQNMIRVWNWLFTPATWAVVLGLLVLAHAVFQPGWIVAVIVSLALLAFGWYYRRFRPTLGTED
jgi:phosphohistidine phosphatase SixA